MLFARARSASRRLIGVVVLAMWLGQWSALAHSIAHAGSHEVVAQPVDGEHDHGDDGKHGWGHQAGTSACDLVDHLLTGQAPGGEPTEVLWLLPETSPIAAGAASNAPGPLARAYEARGPPRA